MIDLFGSHGSAGKVDDAGRGTGGPSRPSGTRNRFGCGCITGKFGTDRIVLFRTRVGRRSYD